MKKVMIVDGNEACSYTSYFFTEMAGIYPITPSSPMAEHIDKWQAQGRRNLFGKQVKVIEMQSEAGAAGMVHGSLVSGLLTSTYTASQGLLLMLPNMYKIAGEMLPLTMHVAARTLSTHALSIFGDQSDIYAARMTGFVILASSSVQDAALLSAVAHLSAIQSSLPFLHFFDGFRTSHEMNKIKVLEEEDYENLIDEKALERFRNKAMNPITPNTRGTASNDDIFFQNAEARNKDYENIPDIVNRYMKKINTRTRLEYRPFQYYGSKSARKVIVAMGSVCETIKETVEYLNKQGEKVGLIEVHLYRPFSAKYFLKEIPSTVKKIAVLDRTKENGSLGEPLYLDVCAVLKDKKIKIVGGRYGLSSKNTTPAQIKAVFDSLEKPVHNFTIGIEDDVTNLSLPVEENFKIGGTQDYLFYGYGSDGMVTASKGIIKLVGEESKKYVQGYFEYDSKKSGGVTVSHLRFSDKEIHKAYYVDNPKFVTVTKDSYFLEFDILQNIADNATLLISTSKTEEELLSMLSDNTKYSILRKNIKLYTINAYALASTLGLGTKISTIMQSAILSLSELMDYQTAKEKMKTLAKSVFQKKGDEIVKANIDAIEEAPKYIKNVKVPEEAFLIEEEKEIKTVTEALLHRKGNDLPVSAFLKHKDGIYEGSTSRYEKKEISEIVPKYIMENCISCNQCTIVCPHNVIRPYLLSEEEYENAPSYVQKHCKKDMVKKEYYFTIGISVKDCTGCGLCMQTCPGLKNNKALIPEKVSIQLREKEQERFDYLSKNIENKNLFPLDTVKGVGFCNSNFEFCGACAGCGETPYIKLLTSLVGEKLMIANATGCSSIYGGSTSSMPYSIPWASSLFEDNAEFGYGIYMANKTIKEQIQEVMQENMDNQNAPLFKKWIENQNDYEITKEIYETLDYETVPDFIQKHKKDLIAKSIWMVGGDGWAYDIGFGGIDHVLSSRENIKILVLDSEVYSNTGGQSSKATGIGSIASFAQSGKKTRKKDLARMAMCYDNVFVASISLGYSLLNTIRIMKQAIEFDGPAIVIAYSPCIAHGIKKGMGHTMEEEKLATRCGYAPVFTCNPKTGRVKLYSKDTDFSLYEKFLEGETRYANLKKENAEEARKLLNRNKKYAVQRYTYFKNLDEQTEKLEK